MFYIGIDNGSSGSIAILDDDGRICLNRKIPVKECLDYTKKAKYFKRLNHAELEEILLPFLPKAKALLERPLVNPKLFMVSTRATRFDEATIVLFEQIGLPFSHTDSRNWQKRLLPEGVSGKDLKKATKLVCDKLFAGQEYLTGLGMQDGLLIAEFLRRTEKGIL